MLIPDNGTTTWTFAYDADGMRTARTDGTTSYSYTYNGGQLTQMTVGADTLTFTYDASGNPQTVTYGGTTYYYVTNLQGDVIAILNSAGTKVVSYTYDAWGNSISVAHSMASTLGTLNPLRYRGYVYDQETGLYYLQSRYYNPKVGRFLNADALVSTGQGLLGNNMFAYCNNNPTKHADYDGHDAVVVLDEDTFGHIGVLVQDENGKWWHFYWGTEGGFIGSFRRIAALFLLSVEAYTWCKEYDGDITLSAVNNSQQYGGDYEGWYYLEGDFSSCIEELKNPEGLYNLYTKNCSQVSLYILSKAETTYREMLLYASRYILPTSAASYIRENMNNYRPVLLSE